MDQVKGFFCNRSNWFYFWVIFLVFIAGVIWGSFDIRVVNYGLSLNIDIKTSSAADWFTAIGTLAIAILTGGLLWAAAAAKKEWKIQKHLELKSEALVHFINFKGALNDLYFKHENSKRIDELSIEGDLLKKFIIQSSTRSIFDKQK